MFVDALTVLTEFLALFLYFLLKCILHRHYKVVLLLLLLRLLFITVILIFLKHFQSIQSRLCTIVYLPEQVVNCLRRLTLTIVIGEIQVVLHYFMFLLGVVDLIKKSHQYVVSVIFLVGIINLAPVIIYVFNLNHSLVPLMILL